MVFCYDMQIVIFILVIWIGKCASPYWALLTSMFSLIPLIVKFDLLIQETSSVIFLVPVTETLDHSFSLFNFFWKVNVTSLL